MFQPTPQQAAIFNAIRLAESNLMIRARAGCGKTTTLEEGSKEMKGRVGLVAYNKAIATELASRVKGRPNVEANTFHSFGYRALLRAVKGCGKPDFKKVERLIMARGVAEGLQPFVSKLVSLAKQRGVGVLTVPGDARPWFDIVEHFALQESLSGLSTYGDTTEELVKDGISAAIDVFGDSLKELKCGKLDFDDMIYGPLALDVPVVQHDWLCVDEAQDTNPARRALARKMMKEEGLSVWVGDEHQAIYGFTGADNDALDVIAREFNTIDLPLSVTYRCPKAVVRVANTIVPDIEAHESAPEGRYDVIGMGDFRKLGPVMLAAEDAILCRLTKPLVETAYDLIRRGIACHIEGRDIAAGLKTLIKKVSGGKVIALDAFWDKLDVYEQREVQRLQAKGQETQAEAVADKCATLRVVGDQLDMEANNGTLGLALDKLFGDTPDGERPKNLTLSTVHKAKGREWGRVYLLGRNKFMPSKWARQPWQQVQERNLIYVAVTRAKRELVEVEV